MPRIVAFALSEPSEQGFKRLVIVLIDRARASAPAALW